MKIPKSVLILGKKILVEYRAGIYKDDSIYGFYDPENSKIVLDADMPKGVMIETFLHECGHALFHRGGLGQSKVGRELEEVIVEQFSIMFAENFCKTRPKTVKK